MHEKHSISSLESTNTTQSSGSTYPWHRTSFGVFDLRSLHSKLSLRRPPSYRRDRRLAVEPMADGSAEWNPPGSSGAAFVLARSLRTGAKRLPDTPPGSWKSPTAPGPEPDVPLTCDRSHGGSTAAPGSQGSVVQDRRAGNEMGLL